MISWLYEALSTTAKWCDEHRSDVESIVASIRRGWEKGGERPKSVQEAWAEGGIDHSGDQLKAAMDRDFPGTSEYVEECIEREYAAGRLKPERPGIHCDHGLKPHQHCPAPERDDNAWPRDWSGQEKRIAELSRQAEETGEPVLVGSQKPDASPPRTREVMVESHMGPGGELLAQTIEPLHPVTELHRKLVGLGKLMDRKIGKPRTQLMRDSIRLMDEVSLYELQELLKFLLANSSINDRLVQISKEALELNSNALRHTIICVLHNRANIHELDEHWWPEQWFTEQAVEEAFTWFAETADRQELKWFSYGCVLSRLDTEEGNRKLRPNMVRNVLLKLKRAKKVRSVPGHPYHYCGWGHVVEAQQQLDSIRKD